MSKCDICGEAVTVSVMGTSSIGGKSTDRGAGNYCWTCMSGLAQNVNYAQLYKEQQLKSKKKLKPKNLIFLFFGPNDIIAVDGQPKFLPAFCANIYLKKWSKNDKIIVVLLADTYDDYWHDTQGFKGIHSNLKQTNKKIQIDHYLLSAKFLRRGRPRSVVAEHYQVILKDLKNLTSENDSVSFLISNSLPFNSDFLRLYYNLVSNQKNVKMDMIYAAKPSEKKNHSIFLEMRLKEYMDLSPDLLEEFEQSLLDLYESFLDQPGDLSDELKELLSLLEKAEKLLMNNNDQNALHYINNALKLDPKNSRALVTKGLALTRLDQTDEALIILDDVIKSDPKYYNAWFIKGITLRNKGDFFSAKDCFEVFIKNSPTNSDEYKAAENELKKIAQIPMIKIDTPEQLDRVVNTFKEIIKDSAKNKASFASPRPSSSCKLCTEEGYDDIPSTYICKQCKKSICESHFVESSMGIYCTSCHERK